MGKLLFGRKVSLETLEYCTRCDTINSTAGGSACVVKVTTCRDEININYKLFYDGRGQLVN